MIPAVEIICPEKKKNNFSDVCLSSRTITRRIEDMSEDLKLRQRNQLVNLEC